MKLRPALAAISATLTAGLAASVGVRRLRAGHVPSLPSPLPAEPRTLATPDGAIRYYERGEGRPLVMLHSINAAATAYELRPIFERLAKGRRVIAFDWLGFGLSERPEIRYSPALYGRVLRHVLETLAGEPADVLALSLSSQYVAVAAAAEPERFHRLVFVSPTGIGDRFGGGSGPAGRAALSVLQMVHLSEAFYSSLSSRPGISVFLHQIFARDQRLPASYLRYAWATCRQPGARHAPLAFVGGRLNDPNAATAYERLRTPALLLFGDEPHFADPEAARMLAARNAHLRVSILPDSGDLPQFEHPEVTASAIDAFLNERL